MAEQNDTDVVRPEELSAENFAWTGWRGILLKEKAEEPEKESAWTGWRGHVEEKKRGE